MWLWEHTVGTLNPTWEIPEYFLEEEAFQFILKPYEKSASSEVSKPAL